MKAPGSGWSLFTSSPRKEAAKGQIGYRFFAFTAIVSALLLQGSAAWPDIVSWDS
jgi:hypothetical protein